MRKRHGYALKRRFVRVLVKMTKNFGQWVGGSDPHIPPLGYAPAHNIGISLKKWPEFIPDRFTLMASKQQTPVQFSDTDISCDKDIISINGKIDFLC